jgi:Ca2+-binding RTX toxin-like protein
LSSDGRGGNDQLTLYGSRQHDWQITESDAGVSANGRVFARNVENLTGGSGDDNFQFMRTGRVSGRLTGGSGGFDMLDYRYLATSGVNVNLTNGTASRVDGGVSGFRAILGSEGNDTLVGNDFANIIHGMGGLDVIAGRGETDYLYGGAGDDYLFGEGGADYLDGQDDNDYLDGGYGLKDTLRGGSGQNRYVMYSYRPYPSLPNYWLPEVEDTDYNSAEDLWVPLYVG